MGLLDKLFGNKKRLLEMQFEYSKTQGYRIAQELHEKFKNKEAKP